MVLNVILSAVLAVLIIGAVIVIVSDDGDPGRKLAWLLVISVLPVVGLVLYLLFGLNFRHHWYFERRHRRFSDLYTAQATPKLNRILFGDLSDNEIRKDFQPLANLMSNPPYVSAIDGNDIEVISSGKRKFDLLMEDIAQAKEYIHLEYFHFGNDKGSKAVKDALMEKARNGVKVRFIYENIANFPITARYYHQMRKAGVEVVHFTNPRNHVLRLITSLNYRNHRKIVVIDGKIGYTGGMNINDHYFHQWRDTHLRIEGDAVASLQYLFLDSWITSGGTLDHDLMYYFPAAGFEGKKRRPTLPPAEDSAPAATDMPADPVDPDSVHPVLRNKIVHFLPDEPDANWTFIQMSYEWVILHARKYIWLQTPYFVPPDPIMSALKTAALSGVEVRLMLPEKADNLLLRPTNRAFYEQCLEAGIRIFLRQGNFIHAKTFVCDDYISSIGTANLDNRSFSINYEVNAYIYDEETAMLNKGLFLGDMKVCREVKLEEWRKRPWYCKALENLMRLFAPLL